MKKWLLGSEENAAKNSYIWNLVASGINALESVLVLMIATRCVSIEAVGIYTIAFSVANLLMCLGKYNVRTFQVTDAKGEYSFGDYLNTRIITIILMCVATVFYSGYKYVGGGYSVRKLVIILFIIFLYGTEAFEDVYLSELQRIGRLDVGAKMFALRWSLTLIAWGVSLIALKDELIAVLIAAVVDAAALCYLIYVVKELIYLSTDAQRDCNHANVRNLLKACLPLCISAMLALYLPTAGRYAIDACLTDADQAYYGFISMPIFVIDLLTMVVFQPVVKQMAEYWAEGRYGIFVKNILKFVIILVGISAVMLIGAYFLGIWGLSLLYGVDLSAFRLELMLLMLGGVAMGFVGLFVTILTIMRRQKFIMCAYGAVSLIMILSINRIVLLMGIYGAALYTMAAMAVLAVALGIGVVAGVKRPKL